MEALLRRGEQVDDRFQVRGILCSGSAAEVHEAVDIQLGRIVAIKVGRAGLSPSLIDEGQRLSAVRHPCVAIVHRAGLHREAEYIALERLHGVTLAAHLEDMARAGVRSSNDDAIQLLWRMVDGLAALGRAGSTLSRLRAGHILLCPGFRVVLAPYGLVHPEDPDPGGADPHQPRDRGQLAALARRLFGAGAVDPGATRLDLPEGLAQLLTGLDAERATTPEGLDRIAHQLKRILEGGAVASRTDRLRVMIVDDDPAACELMRTVIAGHRGDVDVFVANGGSEALRLVRKQPDVMLLDLDMPEMNGIELCMHMRGTGMAPGCTIVSISARAKEHDVTLMSQIGITRFLPKTGRDFRQRMLATIDELAREHGLTGNA